MSLVVMNLKLKREMARAFSSAVWRQASVPKDRSSYWYTCSAVRMRPPSQSTGFFDGPSTFGFHARKRTLARHR